MVDGGINDTALAQADLGIAIGADRVAVETADVVLMRFVRRCRGCVWDAPRSEDKQNSGAVGYNGLAIPIAAGLLYPSFGLYLQPAIGALAMSGSSVLVAVNAVLLKNARLDA
jgi:Cu2+-exporting ATPase